MPKDWMFVQGGVIIGLGVGLLQDEVGAYMIMGLGVGFLLSAIANTRKK